ncbi:MAG: deoxyribodipyrimidine photo-lyase [Pseudomonadota bacterium]
MTAPLQLVWFKRDLRVQDHAALAQAAAHGPVLPLYIAEPGLWALPDHAERQWAFIAETLAELREALAARGQPLVIRVGEAVPILERARKQLGVAAIWSHEETGNAWTYARDRAVAAWAADRGLPWHELQQTGVVRPLGNRDGWAGRWNRFMAEPVVNAPEALPPLADVEPGAIPDSDNLGLTTAPCPERQRGGRHVGLETLSSFLNERGAPYRAAMSGPVSGAVHCSRISPYLAWGALSMREVAHATWARRAQLKALDGPTPWRQSMSSFESRLHWRDHFMQKLEDEPRLEHENLHRAYDGLRPCEPDTALLQAWCSGQTGLPFVDACMRMLIHTGWMNFRMRAMLVAVASYHLWLDWRATGEHIARQFTDYEPGIHWSQVQMQSGTTGINTVRIYNPVKQGIDQDPGGEFIRRWLPELDDVPDLYIHMPWEWEGAHTLLGSRYPEPIVDHLAAAKHARERIWAVRKGEAFKREADAIQHKHGSRKSGVRSPRARRPRRNTG